MGTLLFLKGGTLEKNDMWRPTHFKVLISGVKEADRQLRFHLGKCLTSLNINDTNFKYHKKYSPVGNCEEANLVSKIPAPSIKPSRMPPMAAEPIIATGPSTEEQDG